MGPCLGSSELRGEREQRASHARGKPSLTSISPPYRIFQQTFTFMGAKWDVPNCGNTPYPLTDLESGVGFSVITVIIRQAAGLLSSFFLSIASRVSATRDVGDAAHSTAEPVNFLCEGCLR